TSIFSLQWETAVDLRTLQAALWPRFPNFGYSRKKTFTFTCLPRFLILESGSPSGMTPSPREFHNSRPHPATVSVVGKTKRKSGKEKAAFSGRRFCAHGR